MVKKTKTLISWERNIIFLSNKTNSQPVPQMAHFEKLLSCREMTFKTIFWMENLTQRWTQSGHFFDFQKSTGHDWVLLSDPGDA